MLSDNPVEHGVLGVARAIHGLEDRHAEEYRARRALPMPKDGYAGSGRAPDGAEHPGVDAHCGCLGSSRISVRAPSARGAWRWRPARSPSDSRAGGGPGLRREWSG